MLEGLSGSNPLERIDGQHLVDEALRLRCDGVPFGRWILEEKIGRYMKEEKEDLLWTHVICSSLDLGVQPMLVLVPERRIADQQNVKDDACSDEFVGVTGAMGKG